MIWQDPVDLSYISYEYDHSLLEAEEEGCEARRLTQRACHSTLGLGEQQRLLAELDTTADTGAQVNQIISIHSSFEFLFIFVVKVKPIVILTLNDSPRLTKDFRF